MTRRCQSCARLFPGDVCPGCQTVYPPVVEPVTPVEYGEKRGGGVPPGTSRRRTCADCEAPLPQVRGPIQRCRPCQAKRDTIRHRLNKRDRRAMGLGRSA